LEGVAPPGVDPPGVEPPGVLLPLGLDEGVCEPGVFTVQVEPIVKTPLEQEYPAMEKEI